LLILERIAELRKGVITSEKQSGSCSNITSIVELLAKLRH
jgi:hypothetical protein